MESGLFQALLLAAFKGIVLIIILSPLIFWRWSKKSRAEQQDTINKEERDKKDQDAFDKYFGGPR